MRIEPYSERYIDDVVSLIKNFHAESVGEYDDLFDPDVVIQTIKQNEATSSNAFLLVINDKCEGILFGVRFQSLLNKRQIFQEVIWYVNKSFRNFGVALLKEAENLLKSEGVNIMIMAVLENSKTAKLKKFYEHMGYKLMESHFVISL